MTGVLLFCCVKRAPPPLQLPWSPGGTAEAGALLAASLNGADWSKVSSEWRACAHACPTPQVQSVLHPSLSPLGHAKLSWPICAWPGWP